MELGAKIQTLRTEKKMTATALAKMLNRTESAVRMWESDNSKPDVVTLVEIARIFECSTDYLLSLSPHKNEVAKDKMDGIISKLSNDLAKLGEKQPAKLIHSLDLLITKMTIWKVKPPTELGFEAVIAMLNKISAVIGAYVECVNDVNDYEDRGFLLRLGKIAEDATVMSDEESELSDEFLAKFKSNLLKYNVSKENCVHELQSLMDGIDLSLYEISGNTWTECSSYFNDVVTAPVNKRWR